MERDFHTDFEKLTSRVARTEQSLMTVVEQLDKLSNRLEIFAERVSQSGRTDWKLVVSAVGLGVVIIGAIQVATTSPLKIQADVIQGDTLENDRRIESIREWMMKAERESAIMSKSIEYLFEEFRSKGDR